MQVEVRQWSDHCFAAYVVTDTDRYGTLVGTEPTRERARELGENHCAATVSAGVSDQSKRSAVGELGRSDGSLTTPARPDRTTFYGKEVGCA